MLLPWFQNSSSKRSSVDLEDELNEARPAKLPRPLSCPSYGAENVIPLMRKSRSFRSSSANVLLIQQQRCSLTFNTNPNKSPHLIVWYFVLFVFLLVSVVSSGKYCFCIHYRIINNFYIGFAQGLSFGIEVLKLNFVNRILTKNYWIIIDDVI